MIRTILGFLGLVFLSLACTGNPDRANVSSGIPNKDQIWVSTDAAFSASEFEALRERFPTLSPDEVVELSQWLSLWDEIQREGKIRDPQAPLPTFAEDLRALLGSAPSGGKPEKLDLLIQERYGYPDAKAWKESLNKRVRQKTWEWNPSLLKDYGISPRSGKTGA